uniref:hypothetical protein n=1 Tax=Acinetobacter baumannii TaxID=470 RepID=UPI00339AAF9A
GGMIRHFRFRFLDTLLSIFIGKFWAAAPGEGVVAAFGAPKPNLPNISCDFENLLREQTAVPEENPRDVARVESK